MLICDNLHLKIQEKILFTKLSFACYSGTLMHIKGSNGTGKTSLLRMIAGIQSHSGTIIFNKEIENLKKPYCLYIGHEIGLRPELTVIQNLLFWARMYNSELMLEGAIRYWNLCDVLDTEAYKLSAGIFKKTSLAKMLCCNANLWLLDEVDSNLDKDNLNLLSSLIATKVDTGGIVIFTSHSDINLDKVVTLHIKDFI